MITILIILAFIAVALIYALQFQIVRDYQPIKYYLTKRNAYTDYKVAYMIGWIKNIDIKMIYQCNLKRYSIFDFNKLL